MEDEVKLIEQARAGSTDAFTEIVRMHQARVRAYLGRYTRDSDVVDDLAQEVFLTAFKNLPTYRGESELSYWLLGIARNKALLHLRGKVRRHAHESNSIQTILAQREQETVEDEHVRVEQHGREVAALQECLKKLPEPSAKMLREYYFQERSAVEIARTAGRQEGAVRMALLRVRQILRDCIEKRLAAGGV